MEIKVGNIVRSLAGRDKGMYFLVVDVKEGYAYVSDGKLRKLEKPKKKKIKHLQGMHYMAESEYSENFMVRNVLKEFQKKFKGGCFFG